MLILTFEECRLRYGLARPELTEFLNLGLLRPAGAAPEAVEVDDPDDLLPRLARLHHGLGLSAEAIDLVLLMRQRLLRLQADLAAQTARTRQLERFVQGHGPLLDEG